MKTRKILAALAILSVSTNTYSHCVEKKYYVGGGISTNSENQTDAIGYQFLGGYCLDFNFNNPKIGTAVEVGYMNSGNFDYGSTTQTSKNKTQTINRSSAYDGLWINSLAEYRFGRVVHFLARAGLDVGDDNGIMVGGGLGLNISKYGQVRTEYVSRDTIASVQLNWISEF